MADPVVGITNGVPTSGTGTITTLGQTLLDGAQVTQGAIADAAVTAGATGSVSAKLRSISRDIVGGIVLQAGAAIIGAVTQSGSWVLSAGAAIIGKVGIDQTTDGTTNKVAADVRLAGIAASTGSGVMGTGTQRVAMATDSPGIIATGSQASPSASYLSTVAAGDIAAAASDSGNPVKVGGIGKTANPTAVTDGQRVNAIFDKLGKQIVVGAIRDLKGMQSTTITSSTAETTIVTAVASTFLDLYGLVITNTSATVTKVTIKDSTAGTTRAVYEIPATETRGFMLPVDSAMPQATVNTAWTATCGTSVASVEIAAYYVKNI